MRRVDEEAEAAGLAVLMMMEHAGRALADPLRATDERVVVLAGGGGNGGGGLCAARHLRNSGVDVRVVLDRDPADLSGPAATQFALLDGMGLEPAPETAVEDADVVLEALVGYSLQGALRGRAAELVGRLEESDAEVRSLDVPAGVDATTGERPGPAVAPDETVTLALPKTGLTGLTSTLTLADIGIPAFVFERAGVDYGWPYGPGVTVSLRVGTVD